MIRKHVKVLTDSAIALSYICSLVVVVFVFNVPSTAKVIWRLGHGLEVSSDRLVKPGIELATPGLQGKRFIHYTTAAPIYSLGGIQFKNIIRKEIWTIVFIIRIGYRVLR